MHMGSSDSGNIRSGVARKSRDMSRRLCGYPLGITRAFLWYMFVGMGKLTTNAEREAIDWFRRSLEANRNHALSHFQFAAALALVGDLQEARSIAEAGLALDHGFTIRRYRINAKGNNPTYLAKRELFYEGMRLAGVPEL